MPSPALPSRIQDLPATWARFCLDIERFLLRDLALPLQHRHLLLACSAGSDSTALLLILHCLAPRLGCTISVAHLDHGLRSESSQEVRCIADLCCRLGVPISTASSNVARYARSTGIGVEEAGRTLRYRFLFGVRRRLNADLLLTAHHADDLAEDVLMRLIRGTGWPGLAGMPSWDPTRRLLRPLLHTSKQDLRRFLVAINVAWSEDASNSDTRQTRNRVRWNLMPLLIRENPRFLRNITRLHRQGEMDADLFATMTTPLLREAQAEKKRETEHGPAQAGLLLQSSLLHTLHPGLRLRLYKAVIDDLGPGQTLHDSLLRLDQAWQRGSNTATIQFPGSKIARITPTGIHFTRSSHTPAQETSEPCD
ncbi:tRNA lysidine(34) synthetase TilS [Desulfonatronum thioautotrophicum]|uniref:tRNA lysidine(34) synthetase TilS n=1 Tax=Desulfonatronum thioautotrophicum TaxID=617001 RepID=UPI0005EBC3BC|nr:tRNA lysidine(34) synthetase TilS [Desulfonatronum thioautotrophicum]